jgi:acetyl-CoA carboxylase carboxyl transferase subunit alpha
MVKSKAQRELETIVNKIATLEVRAGDNQDAHEQLQKLQAQVDELRTQIRSHQQSGAWARTELARHSDRPYTLDYVERIFTEWTELHGDRNFGDDPAMICGIARFNGEEVMVIGHQKGRDIKSRVYRNFGQPNPEGYRKALRFMQMAQKFKRPLLTFVDTPGAYPGLGAEERGQAEAIARNLREMARLKVPIITTITGEGGSGGALAIAVADRVLMLENSVYSVITPEGCASIMWRDSSKRDLAAQALKITAEDMIELRVVDEIIPEPPGGAHLDYDTTAKNLSGVLQKHLSQLRSQSGDQLTNRRYDKFRKMAQFFEEA